jgi:hypothetical protein
LTFLLVVVVGALAVVMSLIVGAGVFRAAKLRSASVAPATNAPPAEPASRPAAKDPGSSAAAATIAAAPGQKASAAPPAAPAAPKAPPIQLRVSDAILHGEDFRVIGQGNEKTLVNWTNRDDLLEWVAVIPISGQYEIEFEYAAAPRESGGASELGFGMWPRANFAVMPTDGWHDFKTASVGKMLIPAGRTSVILRPVVIIPNRQLMNLRSIRLTLLHEMEVPTFPDRRSRRPFFRGGF